MNLEFSFAKSYINIAVNLLNIWFMVAGETVKLMIFRLSHGLQLRNNMLMMKEYFDYKSLP